MDSAGTWPPVDVAYYTSVLKGREEPVLGCYTQGKCSKPTISSTYVCVSCGIPYHLSCLPRLKNKVQHIRNNLIKCCGVNNPSDDGANGAALVVENNDLKNQLL